jgi:FkbM family methyltransferase
LKISRFSISALKAARIWHYVVHSKHPKRRTIAADLIRFRTRLAFCELTSRPLHSFSLLGKEIYFTSPYNIDYLFTEVFLDECYKSCQEAPATILDCGSNIGMSIMFFKSIWPNSQIVGVEASPHVFKLLEKNVQDISNVTVLNVAVGDHHGEIPFYSSTQDSLVGSINPLRGAAEAVNVRSIPISDLIDGPLDLLKIDIEGSEADAFSDLESSGKIRLIREMLIEYHHHLPEQKCDFISFLERLVRCGFDYEIAAEMPRRSGGFQDIMIRATRIGNEI